MRVIILAAMLLAPAALASHAPAGRCDSDGSPALGIVQVNAGPETFYVDDRGQNGLWIYRESNGMDGLQRGGASPYVPDQPETCVDDPAVMPDERIL